MPQGFTAMTIMLNALLAGAGFDLKNVRLLRHKDMRSERGRSPYELWRDNRNQFELYQATQSIGNATKLDSQYWASFVGTPSGDTMFVGMYRVTGKQLLDRDIPKPHMDGVDHAGSCYMYDLRLDERLSELTGRLIVDWGPGRRSWIQRADKQNKTILELRTKFVEPEFPGYVNFIAPLSELNLLPASWKAALQSSRGIYLLTCPRTREQYVGSATGEGGFWRRWQDYLQTGHGGDVGLRSRDPSDYQTSILEVAGSVHTPDDIRQMEQRWKSKLQSREMGLNRN